MTVTCGTLITDGKHVLLGHSTGNKHWDIPKGLKDPHETVLEAALREMEEETDIKATASELVYLGTFPYTKGKHLALFVMHVAELIDLSKIKCTSMVHLPNRRPFPELDAFEWCEWENVDQKISKSLSACFDRNRQTIEYNIRK